MSEQTRRPRNRGWVTSTLLLALAALAAAAALVDPPVQPGRGWWPVAIVLAGVAVVVAVYEVRRRPAASTAPVQIEPGRAAAVRAERERAGEEAAVRMLRAEQPELSLLDAVQLVRDL